MQQLQPVPSKPPRKAVRRAGAGATSTAVQEAATAVFVERPLQRSTTASPRHRPHENIASAIAVEAQQKYEWMRETEAMPLSVNIPSSRPRPRLSISAPGKKTRSSSLKYKSKSQAAALAVATFAAAASEADATPGGGGEMVSRHMVAAFDFVPEMNDEVQLRQGERVELFDEEDDGWSHIVLQDGQYGVVPSDFLQVLPDHLLLAVDNCIATIDEEIDLFVGDVCEELPVSDNTRTGDLGMYRRVDADVEGYCPKQCVRYFKREETKRHGLLLQATCNSPPDLGPIDLQYSAGMIVAIVVDLQEGWILARHVDVHSHTDGLLVVGNVFAADFVAVASFIPAGPGLQPRYSRQDANAMPPVPPHDFGTGVVHTPRSSAQPQQQPQPEVRVGKKNWSLPPPYSDSFNTGGQYGTARDLQSPDAFDNRQQEGHNKQLRLQQQQQQHEGQ